MKYYVFQNKNQENELKKLEELHENIKKEKDNFKDIIIEFVSYIRKNEPELIKKFSIAQILSSVNQIVYSFKNFKEAKNDPLFELDEKGDIKDSQKEFDQKEISMALVFFINAKAFLDLIGKFTSLEKDENFNDLSKSITNIRNYFAHYYEKEIENREYFIGLSIERGIREYSVLEINEIKSGKQAFEICFSFELFYFALRDIFKKLKDSPGLFK